MAKPTLSYINILMLAKIKTEKLVVLEGSAEVLVVKWAIRQREHVRSSPCISTFLAHSWGTMVLNRTVDL